MEIGKKRGVLMHISSLPGNYGIGSFGKTAFEFADWLKSADFNLWQVLPLSQTSYGDSPYQSPSAFAGNPYFIDLDILYNEGLLRESDLAFEKLSHSGEHLTVNYGNIYLTRYQTLKKAFINFIPDAYYNAFTQKNDFWLNDYANFMAIKATQNSCGREEWAANLRIKTPESVKFARKNVKEVNFWKFVQYKFYSQWRKLKEYVNSLGIEIIGDMPIYVAGDSADVWANPELFLLGDDYIPSLVAGVPPDYFSAEGQLWGNPLYNWDKLYEQDFNWWTQRIKSALDSFDIVRIDHFRGFESFYAIERKEKSAKKGKWLHAYGKELFDAVKKVLPKANIIAEDLGTLDDNVRNLVKNTGFPGMKVMQFAFDSNPDNEYLPQNYPENCIAYTGTHDNNTTIGWYSSLSKDERQNVKRKLKEYITVGDKHVDIPLVMLRALLDSRAKMAVAPMQDILGLDAHARMNTPSTLGENWKWRLEKIPTKEQTDKILYNIYHSQT